MSEAAVQEQTTTQNGVSDVPTESAALTRTGAMGFGLTPRNFDEGWRMATAFARSTLVPKQYHEKPEDILIAMQYGAEIGLPPMASLQSVAVINGKPGVYGDGFLGVIMSKPAYAKHVEYYELADGTKVRSLRKGDYENDDTKAVSMFWRKGNPEPFVGEFSISDAKRAKLWGKEGPWSNYPARQMKWRARGFAGRDAFAGELRGIKMAEELADYEPDDAVVTSGPAPVQVPVRRSEKPTEPSTASTTENQSPASEPSADAAAAAKPAGRGSSTKASRQASSGDGPSVETKSVAITNVQYCTPNNEDPYTEVTGVIKAQGQSPVAMIFITRDESLAKLAASCEGTDTLVNVLWHGSQRANGKACKVLERIVAAS